MQLELHEISSASNVVSFLMEDIVSFEKAWIHYGCTWIHSYVCVSDERFWASVSKDRSRECYSNQNLLVPFLLFLSTAKFYDPRDTTVQSTFFRVTQDSFILKVCIDCVTGPSGCGVHERLDPQPR
jgi:hypothetical protein